MKIQKPCNHLVYRAFIVLGGPDGTRTRDLLRDRQAF